MSQLFVPMASAHGGQPLCDVEPRRSDGNGAFHMGTLPPSDTGRPPHRHQSSNPPRPRCRSAGASRDENMPATVNRNRSMNNLRSEIRKAVRFVHEEEELSMRGHGGDGAGWQQSHDTGRMNNPVSDLATAPEPDDDDVFGLQERLVSGMKMDEIPILTDEEEAFLMGPAEMMGRSIPRYSSTRTSIGDPLFHKASSFSGVTRGRMVPCSPPVPIPQKQWKRRNSAALVSSRSSSASFLIPSHDQPYSKTQCEARLWDEYWNYKLSLESRESFEASSNQREGDERKEPINAKSRADSEASTDATTQDDQSGGSWVDEEIDMFDMDDL
ncbi:hypothetical protein P43SY_007705 [Pythium insidiosum]|uniref:Uncharacterized protein n=1 Tax=Pythium insidiosum TaxID=114742 RepID=A0AAD5QB55_PYTIN|nr:hypothetical protein P43SY_007705 [Pythium insidiosum]